MQIALDIDDISFQNNGFFWLNKLKDQFPKIKISAFFIPADAQNAKRLRPDEEAIAKKVIEDAVKDGWMELIPHGITHIDLEFMKAKYDDMEIAIKAYEEYFGAWGIPYVKGFKPPQWLIHPSAIDCLNDKGWWLAVDKNQPGLPRAKRNYEYNYDIVYRFPKDWELVKAHGHIAQPSLNNIPECIHNLMKIPADAEWKFVSELMND